MPRKKTHRPHPEEAYETVYHCLRETVDEGVKIYGDLPNIELQIVGAQAECLVKTVRGLVLSHGPRKEKVEYLNWLFSTMLENVLKGHKDISGRFLFREGPAALVKGKKGKNR